MDENKKYLNEEENARISKKLNTIGKILMMVGAISFITCSILIFGNFVSFETRRLLGFLWVFSFAFIGFGIMMFMTANQRKISAYMMQQQMPLVKEGAKEMAPVAGDVAKEITKGVKEGLKDDEE